MQPSPAPVRGRQVDLPQLRCGPVVGAHEGHGEDVLSLHDGLGARYPLPVDADQIPMLLVRPGGEHLPATLLVELHVGVGVP